jgi:hypothetical protein
MGLEMQHNLRGGPALGRTCDMGSTEAQLSWTLTQTQTDTDARMHAHTHCVCAGLECENHIKEGHGLVRSWTLMRRGREG